MRMLLNPAWVAYRNSPPAGGITPSGPTYQALAGTLGPLTATPNATAITVGTEFKVTASSLYVYGFWLWVCPGGGQAASGQTFGLWQVTGASTGTFVPGTAITSGTLIPGQWNCVVYTTIPPLTPNVPYRAVTGFTGPYPSTLNEWNSGGPYAAGIVNGPLTVYSDATGSLPDPYSGPQSSISVAGSDPAAFYPGTGSSGFNAWIDVEITGGS